MKKTIRVHNDGFLRALKINELLEQGYTVRAVDGDLTVLEIELDSSFQSLEIPRKRPMRIERFDMDTGKQILED
jgi:hypothetical protein